jgi:hypothetical protein
MKVETIKLKICLKDIKNVYKSVKMVGKTEANGEGVVDFMFDEQEIVPDNTKQQKKEKKKTIVEIDAVKATNSLF